MKLRLNVWFWLDDHVAIPPGSGQDAMVNLPLKQLIRDAKAGSPTEMWELATVTEESSNYSIAALDTCLAHLGAHSLPKLLCGLKDNRTYTLRWSSITCLWRILRACGGLPKVNQGLRTATAERLADTFEGGDYLDGPGLSFPLKNGTVTLDMLDAMAEILQVMMKLDDTLQSHILHSPRAMSLCLKLWNGIRRKDGASFVEVTLKGNSPVPELFLLLYKKSPEALYNSILSAPVVVQRGVVSGLVSRINEFRLWALNPQYPYELVWNYTDMLTDIAVGFACNPTISTRLKKAKCLTHWASTRIMLHQKAGRRLPGVITVIVFYLRETAFGPGQNPILNLIELVSSHFSPPLFDTFRNDHEPRGEHGREGGIELFSEVMSYIYYPRTHEALKSAIVKCEKDIAPRTIWGLLHKYPPQRVGLDAMDASLGEIRCHFQAVEGIRAAPASSLRQPHGKTLVDCIGLAHDQRVTSIPHNAPPKACSSCKTVLYCSVECQTQDWKDRHREECNVMRQSHLSSIVEFKDRWLSGVRYTKEMRFAHAAIITQALNDIPGIIEGRREAGKSDSEVITFGDFGGGRSGPGGLRHMNLELLTYIKGMSSPDMGECDAMNKRAVEMIHLHRSRKTTSEFSANLTEALFHWTPGLMVFVMAEHYYNEKENSWELLGSLVRFR
ncbi:hypothetical protein BKA70DRAFT_1406327 [Coprinopsis sp. MPI-PUGE-AT-0042]|nr:hypothetical protein BKA70DRAFT_1406327 [Coprinopsis sp. MPI-PUGE-AT-0042]